ncbi:hypothetical protein [Streptomyces antimycoticus]|uniref:hypothetical protein n=1 Tax=Streptomyces antimycoticus TaxID=68175 RepID=UPI00380C5279
MTGHHLPPAPAGGPAAQDRFAQSAALVDGLDPVFTGPLFDGGDPRLSGVFMRGSRQVRLDITALPLVMRREVGWWLATCARTGERQAHASEWNRWTATATDVIARQPHVTSFTDCPLTEWMTAWARRFHADRGRMPTPGHRLRAEHALRGMLEPARLHVPLDAVVPQLDQPVLVRAVRGFQEGLFLIGDHPRRRPAAGEHSTSHSGVPAAAG